MERRRISLKSIVPILGIVLVFLGPLFFYAMLQFLRTVDYAAGTLAFLSGWCLLRAGVDLTRAALADTYGLHEPSKDSISEQD